MPYYYVVSSVSGNGVESADSAEVSATPMGPPPAPTGLAGAALADGQIGLSWIAATGANTYNVYRSTSSGGSFTNIASGIALTSYTDLGAADGSVSYFYEISSVNGSGEGPKTAPLGIPTAFQLEFTFEDTGTSTVDSIAGLSLSLLTNGVPTDYHGSATSGVAKHGKALDFSGNPLQAGVGPIADVLNSPKLGYGTINTFTVTEWYKQTQLIAGPNNFSPRLFVIGANGASDFGSANSITFKINTETQLQVDVGANGPYSVNLNTSLPTNQWLFFAVTYDGTNVNMYTGSETTPATLASSTAVSGLSVNFGTSGSLILGNRTGLDRTFAGFIDDFRFYTVADSTAQIESIRQSAAPVLISNLYPDGLMLQENTNTLSATITSPNQINPSGIQLSLNGTLVTSGVSITPGGNATSQTLIYPGLNSNVIYSATISITDAAGYSGAAVVNFDTFATNNFTWEAEEFDYGGGLFIDNPDYTDPNFAFDANSYSGLDSVQLVDNFKNSGNNLSAAADYRAGNGDPTHTQTPPATGELPRPKFLDDTLDTNAIDHMIGDSSSSDWQNYTKTYPAGSYNVYARMAEGSGVATVTLAEVTSGWGTTTQTTTNLGTFSFLGSGFASFAYVPLRDSLGNLAVFNMPGTNTLRTTLSTSVNINFYMLVPANTNLPIISGVYPDGRTLFEATNKLVFTVSSGVAINTNSILLSLNGTNITGLTFAGGPNSWNVSYTGLQFNQSYAAVISVTDANGNSTSSSLKLDTWSPLFQVEAEDFDFSSGQYIDNPVPTSGPAADSYFGQVGNELVDEHTVAPHTGASALNYRANDFIATTPISDTPRQQFLDANAPDYNVGFLGAGFWENYTKTWPAGTYNIYGRMASGNGGFVHTRFDQITGGWGTTGQLTTNVGTFTLPASGGYSSYLYVPLIDKYGNYANVTLNGTNTFRTTEDGPVNINFYMLLAARTDLPRIDNVYPDGSTALEGGTSTFSFIASGTNGIATTNVQVTLNGVNVSSSLNFAGSANSYTVSYPSLMPNSSYTEAISIKDGLNQTAATTVSFDTFSAANFTWEAEDFDFSDGLFIDNPAASFSMATNSYYNQVSDPGVDENYITYQGTHIYRPADFIPTEITSDAARERFLAARQAALDPTIQDFDVYDWVNTAWINYTRTYPTGSFHVYARLAGGNGAFNPTLGTVTSGWGTPTQTVQNLGTFAGTGTSFTTWQYVELVDPNTLLPVTLSLSGTNTLRVTTDGNVNANFYMLVPVAVPGALKATINGGTIQISFATQMGFSYTISTKNSLSDATWTPMTTIPGDGTTHTVNDTTGLTSRFYQLSVH